MTPTKGSGALANTDDRRSTHLELMELSKDIGQVAAKVSSLETGLTALDQKLQTQSDYQHARNHDILNEIQKASASRDKNHLELVQQHKDAMATIAAHEQTIHDQGDVIERMTETVEFIERWRGRAVGVILTAVGLGGALTWVLKQTAAVKGLK